MIKLKAKIDSLTEKLINNKEKIYELTSKYEGPINIMFPSNVKKNIEGFKRIISDNKIDCDIHFAQKCTKSKSLLKEILNNNVKVDVSSINQLKLCLETGFSSKDIEATGPKSIMFLEELVKFDVLINIDNECELEQVISLSKKYNKRVKILLRLNSFNAKTINFIESKSRFGIEADRVNEILKRLILENNIVLLGFSFHLDTVNINEKIVAIEHSLRIFNEAYNIGLSPYILDIGGGFKVSYLDSKETWNSYISELKQNILNNKEFNWKNNTFGLRIENNVLKGKLNIYEYYQSDVKEQILDIILNTKLEAFQGRKIKDILNDNLIKLIIEPGRSLIDNCGITIGRVNFIKKYKEDKLIGMNMKKSDLLMGDFEFFVDPIHIPLKEKKYIDSYYMIGNLCMESDFLYSRKIPFDNEINIGDLIIFPNTAGYMMDFAQTNSIMQDIGIKFVYENKKFRRDD